MIETLTRLTVLRRTLDAIFDRAAARDDWERADAILLRIRAVSAAIASVVSAS